MNNALIHYWLGANGIDLLSTLEGVARDGIHHELNVIFRYLHEIGWGWTVAYKMIMAYAIAYALYRWGNSEKLYWKRTLSAGTFAISSLAIVGGLLWQLPA